MVCFKNMGLDNGIRKFLEHFTLPGESQKVDRVLEKFAQKFYEDNPESFNSATAAYTLSYLLMMLQTDLHNPQVKVKMKLTEFIKLARGINDGSDLPVEYMNGLYTRIQKKALALHDKEESNLKIQEAINSSLKKKQYLFQKETEQILEKGKEFNKQKKDNSYYYVNSSEYIRPFLEMAWSPFLATISLLLEETEDPTLITNCLEGFSLFIKLTGVFGLNTERDAFVASLAKFTALTSTK